jgi:predicted extracellular nuclease
VLIVNHFKSKREGESETAARRLAQAQHILDLVAEWETADSQANVIVLGDFNDYELSEPMQVMTNGGLFNTLSQLPLAERYSFVFSGAAQLIDGLFVSPALVDKVTAVHIFHINADYPDNLAEDGNMPYQATDHDLPLLVLTLDEVIDPTATAVASPTPQVTPTPEPATNSSGNWIGLAAAGGGAVLFVAIFWLWRSRRV